MHLSVAGVAAATFGTRAVATDRSVVVVELFTHQGCASCPPADAFLAELSQRPDVMVLSLHVDYWDYLGWRDTVGSPDCAARQREYARRRGDGDVYTPQVIVNGQGAFVGSDRQGILNAIESASVRQRTSFIPVAMTSRGRELAIEVAAAPGQQLPIEATVWVVSVVPRVTINVTRGENAGRTLAYINVVRKITPAGVWHGSELALSLPKDAILSDASTCAALLQVDGTGPIIGAGWMAPDAA